MRYFPLITLGKFFPAVILSILVLFAVSMAGDISPLHSGSEKAAVDTVAGHPTMQNISPEPGIVEIELTATEKPPNDPLPEMKEKLLILSDNRFSEDGSLDFPEEAPCSSKWMR